MTQLSVRELRRCWKPHKERLYQIQSDHPTAIRFHRACSWLDQAQKFITTQQYDMALINQWIAFNALYGQWDQMKNDPCPDRESWRIFCDTILRIDEEQVISGSLTEHKRLVMALLDDEYLSNYYWKEPSPKRAKQARKSKFDARTWYLEKRWALILERSLERVYLIRCQLIHGAATHGGKLNRTSLKHCGMMLNCLLPTFLKVYVENGSEEEWGTLCYPPSNGSSS